MTVRLNVLKTWFALGLMACLGLASSVQAMDSNGYDWRSAEVRVQGDLCDTADHDFDGFRYQEHIPHCRRNVSHETKRAVANQFGIFDNFQNYEIDHYIPLSIGGSNSTDNLWPLPVPVARAKCELEGRVHQEVVRGEISQEQAIERVKEWKKFLETRLENH